MPCMCWYEPSDEEKKQFKFHCQAIVDLVKSVSDKGDAMGTCTIKDAHELIDHLYNPKLCKEKQDASGSA